MDESDPQVKRRLRIAVLNRQFTATGGGAERYSMALVEHLASQHEIHVFAQQIAHAWPGVTYHRVGQPLKRPRWLNQLWYATATWWATRAGFDVVHSHENTWHGQVQTVHVLPVKYKLFAGLRGLAWGLRWLKVLTSPRWLVYRALERSRFSLARQRTIVLVSPSLITPTLAAYPHCRQAIKVVTPGVDQIHGIATTLQKSESRMRLGLPQRGYCILFVGNDYQKKGLETLIHALGKLPDCAYLAVVGNPGQVSRFKRQAVLQGLADRVHFLGSLQDIAPAYTSADCLAHPTLEDTFAMTVLEAMSYGLPVVVSGEKYCGIAGLLAHETHALLLDDPQDDLLLARLIGRVLSEPDLRLKLHTSALAFARQHLWSSVARQQEDIYLVPDRKVFRL